MNAIQLSAQNITKSFGPVKAVIDVSIDIRMGEVLGLVGENGAGKSTLLSLISGTLKPDSGSLILGGKTVSFSSYHEATTRGVFRVYQHQALVPNLTVAENIYLAQEKSFSRFGITNFKKMEGLANEILLEFDLDIRANSIMGNLSFAERQVVEIVRCIAQSRLLDIERPVILLDEPTAALTREQIDFFFGFVRRMRNSAAQVFISHRLEEITTLCDRLIVLKDGKVTATSDQPEDLSEHHIHALMVGREVEAQTRTHTNRHSAEPTLTLRNFTSDTFTDVSLELHAGEIIGVAGVVGSGKSHLGRSIFELGAGCSGEIRVFGHSPRGGGPRNGIRAGIGYVPGERHLEGLILGMSVSENHALPQIGAAIGSPLLHPKKDLQAADRTIQQLKVKTPTAKTLIKNLSGGNQQKVILGRWISLESKILVLDNPTNGVDVGAKAEIYSVLESLTDAGVSIVLISDDLPELISLSDRVVVMKDGKIVAEHDQTHGEALTEVQLVSEMV